MIKMKNKGLFIIECMNNNTFISHTIMYDDLPTI